MSFSLNETTILSAINGGGLLSSINSTLSPGYGIYTSGGVLKALSPTSFLGIEYGADASVVSAPIEQGSYSSYNKVERPPVIRVMFTLEGWSGFSGGLPNLTNFSLTSRSDTLAALDKMVSSALIYDIETPDTTYESYDLIRYNYRTSDKEVTLLTVEAIFQAVLQEAGVTITSATGTKQGPSKPGDIKGANGRTENGNSGVTGASLSDVKGALSGLKKSLSSAATKVASSVSKGANNATSGFTGEINGAATSSIDKLSEAVNDLVKGLS